MTASSPIRAANEILKAWFYEKPETNRYPVDCYAIAEEFGIKVHGDNLGSEFQGALFIKPGLKAIIYNNNIREDGRKNFTIGHELGHFFLHKYRKELQCSWADFTDFTEGPKHPENIEQEANQFAVTLLMPFDDFRKFSQGKEPSIMLLRQLAQRYQTSLTATAYRMAELANRPLALVIVKENRVIQWRRNHDMKQTGFWLNKGGLVSSTEQSEESNSVDADVWLDENQASSWYLTQSSIYMPYYDQTLILISAESREFEQDEWEDLSDSVDQIPSW